jgi:hypothetical protein
MARHSDWTRAKPPDGLERPPFWQPKAGQNVMGSLQPRKQGSALFAKCFARVQLRGRGEEEETHVDHQ